MEQGAMVERYKALVDRIAQADKDCGVDKPAARFVAVSKTYDGDHIRPILKAGHRLFGENRVQESAAKWPALRETFAGVELHLIGPLQSNKAKEAVALFDVIQTIDREKIAKAVARECVAQGKKVQVFVQVNIGNELQKAGIACGDAQAFVARCRQEHGLGVLGLMCIPPVDDDPSSYFNQLADMAAECDVQHLSMGMSADYERAIACGATYVRVGSALFGSRAI